MNKVANGPKNLERTFRTETIMALAGRMADCEFRMIAGCADHGTAMGLAGATNAGLPLVALAHWPRRPQ